MNTINNRSIKFHNASCSFQLDKHVLGPQRPLFERLNMDFSLYFSFHIIVKLKKTMPNPANKIIIRTQNFTAGA